jgi:hypothetical protein
VRVQDAGGRMFVKMEKATAKKIDRRSSSHSGVVVKRKITQIVVLGEREMLALSDDGLLFRANGDLSDLSWEAISGLPDIVNKIPVDESPGE